MRPPFARRSARAAPDEALRHASHRNTPACRFGASAPARVGSGRATALDLTAGGRVAGDAAAPCAGRSLMAPRSPLPAREAKDRPEAPRLLVQRAPDWERRAVEPHRLADGQPRVRSAVTVEASGSRAHTSGHGARTAGDGPMPTHDEAPTRCRSRSVARRLLVLIGISACAASFAQEAARGPGAT